MDKRETSKIVEIDGRKFRVNKFDAMTGSYIAYKLMGEMLPMGIGDKVGVTTPKGSQIMSKTDFIELQKDCLKVCYEVLPAGDAPILDANERWGVADLEKDAKTVLALTVHTLIFNVSSFFDASLLSSMAEAMSTIFPLTAKT